MMFDKVARILSIIFGRTVTPWEVAQTMIAVKQVRMSVDPLHIDNYVDQVNYTAFAAQFAGIAEEEDLSAFGQRFGFKPPAQPQEPEVPQDQ
jgi:hypothetical protein